MLNSSNNSDFQNLIEIAAKKLGIGTEINAIKICHEVKKMLVQIFPQTAAQASNSEMQNQDIQVISYQNQTLTLAAKSSTWMHQLNLKKELIKQGVNQKFGPNTVKKIRIKII